MGGLVRNALNKIRGNEKSSAPLASDSKTKTAETPSKVGRPKRRRAREPVDSILNESLGGDL